MQARDPKKLLTVRQAAEHARISVPGIYQAIRAGRLRVTRRRGRCLLVDVTDIDAYRASKYQRACFRPSAGQYSLSQAALALSEILGHSVTRNTLAAAVRCGLLRHSRVGHHIVVTDHDIDDYASLVISSQHNDGAQLSFA